MHRHLAVAGLAFALAGCAAASSGENFRGTALPVRPAPDFTLTSDAGTPWTLSAQHGRVIALFFGYTHCTDTCPTTLAKLGAALRASGANPSDAEVAFVTVDPQRDTPAVMHAYLHRFSGARFVGLTGSSGAVRAVEEQYHIFAQRRAAPKGGTDYSEVHDSFTYLIDRKGDAVALHDDGDSQASFAHDFRVLLR